MTNFPNQPPSGSQQPPQGGNYGGQPPHGYQPQGNAPPMTAQQARAHAKGAKAQAKAMRPLWKKKRFWLGLIIGLIVLIAIINSLGGSDPGGTAVPATDTTTTAPAPAPAPKKSDSVPDKPSAAGVGDKVSAGDWDFTVTKFKCGVKSVGSEYLNKKPQGQFCLVNLSVKNNGDKAETLLDSNQKLLDKDGREYSSDSEASIYEDAEGNLLAEEINPGNTAKGLIVFDIPKGVKPVQATLAGGFLGVKDVAVVDLTD